MDSAQSDVSLLNRSSKKQNTDRIVEDVSYMSREIDFRSKGTPMPELDESLGALEVHIHQARDIHNICIYQKQDVYAKLCLTTDPDNMVSTKIINSAGHNPVFDEKLRLNVRNVDSSLKCEIWMLSRVKNYLDDQLLGFALVPVSEILLHGGELAKEFSLSSTDLFHSPAGFVDLSLSYVGAEPEVIPIPAPSGEAEFGMQEKELINCLSSQMDRVEFPDPNVMNENHQMVEEYFEILVRGSDTGNRTEESTIPEPSRVESPPSSVSTVETSFVSAPVSFDSSEDPKESRSPAEEEHVSPPKDNDGKEKNDGGSDAEGDASGVISSSLKPLMIEPESEVIEQDIVDMYMKSMQQFTESLAKMKLPDPLDYENGPSSSENSSTGESKTPASKKPGSRVFYGSRAFF